MKSAGYIKNGVKRITGGDTFDAFAYPWNIFRIPATPFAGSSQERALGLVPRVFSLPAHSSLSRSRGPFSPCIQQLTLFLGFSLSVEISKPRF